MAKAVTTTIKDSFFDDPFFKASKQKMKNILYFQILWKSSPLSLDIFFFEKI